MNPDSNDKTVSAAMLAIGDELLSGRTRDKNIGHLATSLTLQGIDLKEVRIVADEAEDIVAALNALRQKYTYVFSSGGIGPTHDDITADAVASAFGVAIDYDPRAMAILEPYYRERNLDFTTARKRMARIPEGADLIPNTVSMAPGFILQNVHVMAGVPSVFRAMLEEISPKLEGGMRMLSETVECEFGEGTIGDRLADIQKNNPDTSIGSYPRFDGERYSTQIVIRGRDQEKIDDAAEQVKTSLVELRD
ncbi:MAG: competence/damage-inducible protein A [Pseudomonadota bacterium]